MKFTLVFVLFAAACGGSIDSAPETAHNCEAHSGRELLMAPQQFEYPTCVEVPNPHEDVRDSRRAWCCPEGTPLR